MRSNDESLDEAVAKPASIHGVSATPTLAFLGYLHHGRLSGLPSTGTSLHILDLQCRFLRCFGSVSIRPKHSQSSAATPCLYLILDDGVSRVATWPIFTLGPGVDRSLVPYNKPALH